MKRKELLVFFLLASLGCEHSLDPFRTSNRSMVFESDRGGRIDIYRMRLTGDNILNLTADVNDFTDDRRPIFSPDGSKIAFETELDSQIYVMDSDGSNKVRLFQGHAPNFSPDGARIVFFQNGDVWLINIDGSNRLNVTNHPVAGVGGRPQFSPDGLKIFFMASEEKNNVVLPPDIYRVDIDGRNRINLTNHPGFDWFPQISPDGTSIAFYTYRENKEQIYLMNWDGTRQRFLTLGSEPQFSPDGAKVTFITRKVNTEDQDIHIINANGSDRKHLAQGRQPKFSPEGSKIVFEKKRNGNLEIYMINLDGSNETNLTNHPANDFGAVFPPLQK